MAAYGEFLMAVDTSDLLSWMKGLCLDGDLARAEPKRLRYTLLHTAGVVVRSARQVTLRLAEGWPWADDLVAARRARPSCRPPNPRSSSDARSATVNGRSPARHAGQRSCTTSPDHPRAPGRAY